MKNFIFIAMLCVGVAAKGNTVKWTISGGSPDWIGYKAFLVESIDSSWKSVADIESSALNLAQSGTFGDIVDIGRGASGFLKEKSATGANITEEKMSSVCIVVVNPNSQDGYYYIKGVDMSASVYDESQPGQAPAATITKGGDISLIGTFSDPGPGPDPTPEPTSGLLLLLGAAGLALRRRVK